MDSLTCRTRPSITLIVWQRHPKPHNQGKHPFSNILPIRRLTIRRNSLKCSMRICKNKEGNPCPRRFPSKSGPSTVYLIRPRHKLMRNNHLKSNHFSSQDP